MKSHKTEVSINLDDIPMKVTGEWDGQRFLSSGIRIQMGPSWVDIMKSTEQDGDLLSRIETAACMACSEEEQEKADYMAELYENEDL